jgi:hypothetical protein
LHFLYVSTFFFQLLNRGTDTPNYWNQRNRSRRSPPESTTMHTLLSNR